MYQHHAYSLVTGDWLGTGTTARAALYDAVKRHNLNDTEFVEVVEGRPLSDLAHARAQGQTTYRGAGYDVPDTYLPGHKPVHACPVPLA